MMDMVVTGLACGVFGAFMGNVLGAIGDKLQLERRFNAFILRVYAGRDIGEKW